MSSDAKRDGTTGDAQLDAALTAVERLKALGATSAHVEVGAARLDVQLAVESPKAAQGRPRALSERDREELQRLRAFEARVKEIPGMVGV